MGYTDATSFKIRPFDGYGVTTDDGYAIVSQWIDVQHTPFIDISVVFTGGSPAGTLSLMKSNATQWTGGNWGQPLFVGTAGGVSDAVACPTGSGTVTATVTSAGVVYTLNQQLVGYRWLQLVFTPSNSVTTQIDAWCSWKRA